MDEPPIPSADELAASLADRVRQVLAAAEDSAREIRARADAEAQERALEIRYAAERDAERLLRRAARWRRPGPRQLQAAIHAAWCSRASLAEPAPWPIVLALYDALLTWRDDAVVRLNRAVAVAEVSGPAVALAEVDWLDSTTLRDFGPFHAVRADLLARLGRGGEAVAAYDRALAVDPAPAERLWLERRRGLAAGR